MGMGMFHRQLLKTVIYHRYIVPKVCNHPSIYPSSFPQAQFDPVQMAEVVQQECVLVGGVWLYHRVNVANIVHLPKYHG